MKTINVDQFLEKAVTTTDIVQSYLPSHAANASDNHHPPDQVHSDQELPHKQVELEPVAILKSEKAGLSNRSLEKDLERGHNHLCKGMELSTSIIVLLCLIFSFPVIQTALIASNLDGLLSPTSWRLVFLPLWVIVGVIQFGVLPALSSSKKSNKNRESWDAILMGQCIAVLVQGILLIFPIFVVLRIDNVTDWTWSIIFIPVFIVALEVLCCGFAAGNSLLNEDKEKNIAGIAVILATLALFPALIVIPLWLDGVYTGSLFEAFTPLWVCVLILAVPGFTLGPAYFVSYIIFAVTPFVIFPLLIALKYYGLFLASWIVVFIPFFIPSSLIGCFVVLWVYLWAESKPSWYWQ